MGVFHRTACSFLLLHKRNCTWTRTRKYSYPVQKCTKQASSLFILSMQIISSTFRTPSRLAPSTGTKTVNGLKKLDMPIIKFTINPGLSFFSYHSDHFLSARCRCRGFLVHLIARNDTPHWVGLHRKRDRPLKETST